MLRVGILGAGNIARAMSRTLRGMYRQDRRAELYAVASRDMDKAQAFARQEGAGHAYGSYEAMLADPSVDLVYIATPHSHHAEHMKLCLAHKKPVLCEKAFTANARQAEEILAMAEQENILVTEAIWTRYMPYRKMVSDLIAQGEIGTVHMLTANLGYDIDEVPRVVLPELAGGALLDIGVYCLNFASMVMGDSIRHLDVSCVRMDTGVDLSDVIALHYAQGGMADLMCTATNLTDRNGVIYGEKGWIRVDNINNPSVIEVWKASSAAKGPERRIPVPVQITGYEYEVDACILALQEGRVECEAMPHSETLEIMRQMDAIRSRIGLRYPFETDEP